MHQRLEIHLHILYRFIITGILVQWETKEFIELVYYRNKIKNIFYIVKYIQIYVIVQIVQISFEAYIIRAR